VGIDGIEVVFQSGEQDETAIDPVEIGAGWVERLVGEKGNPGGVLAENGKRVVQVKLSVEVGNVGGPEFLRSRALLRDPTGNLFENRTAQAPMMKILGAADGKLSFSDRT